MLKLRRNSRAQSLSEYALLIAIIGAALIGMQTYMKRGIQGVVKLAADEIGNQRNGSIEEGKSGEIRTTLPGHRDQKDIDVETNATTQVVRPLIIRRPGWRGGEITYTKNQTTNADGDLYHEMIYNEE
jgi:Flp pilus assembly pilin Flp